MTLKEYERLAENLDGMELYKFIVENWDVAQLSMQMQEEEEKRKTKGSGVVLTPEMDKRIWNNIMKDLLG